MRLGWTVAAIPMLLAGCASTPTPPATPATVPAGLDPDHVLVSIADPTSWPGLAEVEDGRLLTLTADGTLVARGTDDARMAITTTRLDRDGLDRAWASVIASGAAVDAEYDLPGVFDRSTTFVRVDDGSRATELSIYALGEDAIEEPFSPEEQGRRTAAAGLISELRLLAGLEPWTPPALLLWWSPSGDPAAPVVPWGASLDLATGGGPVDNPFYQRCVRLEGDQAAAVADMARRTASNVDVEQDGARYQFAVRPIYPDELDEVDCP